MGRGASSRAPTSSAETRLRVALDPEPLRKVTRRAAAPSGLQPVCRGAAGQTGWSLRSPHLAVSGARKMLVGGCRKGLSCPPRLPLLPHAAGVPHYPPHTAPGPSPSSDLICLSLCPHLFSLHPPPALSPVTSPPPSLQRHHPVSPNPHQGPQSVAMRPRPPRPQLLFRESARSHLFPALDPYPSGRIGTDAPKAMGGRVRAPSRNQGWTPAVPPVVPVLAAHIPEREESASFT